MKPTLLLATNNKGKLREIRAILADLPVDLVLPAQLGITLDPAETGSTYAENAAIKALAFQQASGLLTLADDSGLEVDALGGEPGVFSARYAPARPGSTEKPSDADRRAYLIDRLSAFPAPRTEGGWPAHFHCTIALAVPNSGLLYADGNCYGEIIRTERGFNGFGYDPIFYIPEMGCTMAELPEDTKNQISHRARALQAALPLLTRLLLPHE